MKIPVKVRNLEVHARVRVLLAPLTKDPPCMEAVSISLIEPPSLEFRLVPMNMGVINAIPKLVDKIGSIIRTVLVDLLLWPSKIVVELGAVEAVPSASDSAPAAAESTTKPKPRAPPPAWLKTVNTVLFPLKYFLPPPPSAEYEITDVGIPIVRSRHHLNWLRANLADVRAGLVGVAVGWGNQPL